MPWFSHPIKRITEWWWRKPFRLARRSFLRQSQPLEGGYPSGGLVYGDYRSGIDRLLADWRNNRHAGIRRASLRCFEEKLHIRNCAKRLIELLDGSEESNSYEEHMKITILQEPFAGAALRGGAIEKAWEALGQAFAKQGHEVTHVSRLCDGLPPREKIGEVRHIRVGGANAVSGAWLLKLLELPCCFGAGEFFPRRTCWLPMLSGRRFFFKDRFGKLCCRVRTLSQGTSSAQEGFPVSNFDHAVAKAVIREIPNRENLVSVLPYPLGWSVPENKPAHERPKRILYAGRLHPEKGVLELIEAFGGIAKKEGKEWVLRIMGPWREDQGGERGDTFARSMIWRQNTDLA